MFPLTRKKNQPCANRSRHETPAYRNCGHYEQVKVGRNWKCASCGQVLTLEESLRNSIDISQAMTTAIASNKPLDESLDEIMGHREWEEMKARIPTKRESSKRRTSKRRHRTTPSSGC